MPSVKDRREAAKGPSARQTLARLQGMREHSEKELRVKLGQRGFADAEVSDALDFAQRHSLQDDKRYASSQGRMLARKKGNRQLSAKLQANGIDKALVQAVLEQLPSEEERAFDALGRFHGQALTAELRGKAWRFLAARGFSTASIAEALKRYARQPQA